MKKALCVIMASLFVFSFTACSFNGKTENETERDVSTPEAEENITSAPITSDMFTDRDIKTDIPSDAVKITLSGKSMTSDSDGVRLSGTDIIISEEAEYIISGNFSGRLVVNAPETAKIRLIFDSCNIESTDSAPLYIKSADKVFVTLKENTENSLISGDTFTEEDGNNIDGTVFSKADMTFNGKGSLEISSPAGHGIVCKDDLVITGGEYTVISASHGFDVNDSVRVLDGTVTIISGKDGIHSENEDNPEKGFVYIENGTFDIESEGDGISAGLTLEVKGGSFNILSGGGYVNAETKTSENWGNFPGMGGPGGGKGGRPGGMPGAEAGGISVTEEETADSESIKGIKATGNIVISGGTFTVDSADDSIHSNASVNISGGEFTLSSGDDGIHADETLFVSGGKININESYEGLEGLHLRISAGDITLNASDDGFNAAGGTDMSGTGGFRGGDRFGGGMSQGNGSIVISGGNIAITASGDGIDANGYLEITDGFITVTGPTMGDTATLDYDTTATINGGTFIGTGASGMAQSFSDGSQGVIAVSVGNQMSGTEITVTDKNGNEIISYTPLMSFAVVIISSPDIIKGEEYRINIGTASGEFTAG